MKERIWVNRDSETVFQHLHPDASAPLHDERVTAIWKEPNLHLEFHHQGSGRLEAAKTQKLPASRRPASLDAKQKLVASPARLPPSY